MRAADTSPRAVGASESAVHRPATMPASGSPVGTARCVAWRLLACGAEVLVVAALRGGVPEPVDDRMSHTTMATIAASRKTATARRRAYLAAVGRFTRRRAIGTEPRPPEQTELT